MTATTEPTDIEVGDAILNALAARPNEELVCFTTIRDQVPGSRWQQARVLTRLWYEYRIYNMSVWGNTLVGLEDDDALIAKARAEGRIRQPPRCI